ncbi:MAG: hypothetical protein IJY08_00460 [Clostridia bacterium]|nr:hypothetical protein [Clostridia bacterium]
MKSKNIIDALNGIDRDMVEDAEKKRKKISVKRIGHKWWIAVACLCLAVAISAGVIIPLITDTPGGPGNDPPRISTMISGDSITGRQEQIFGDPASGSAGEADIAAPGFEIRTVIETEVIEVLPDTYYYPALKADYHVVKLRVLDSIRGAGLPDEIFFCYENYDTNIFDGYDSFIMSVEQIGVENYMLINDTQKRVDYFSNMFEVRLTGDLGYGSVIAFNNGRVDDSFWDKADYLISKISNGTDWIDSMLDSPDTYDYPASRNSTLSNVRSNIIRLAEDEDNYRVCELPCDYVTEEDIFISDEADQIKEYLSPSAGNVFSQSVHINPDRVVAVYTRIINGFVTDETISINGYTGDNGNIVRNGEGYTKDDLSNIPDLGEALDNIDLSKLTPPHIELTSAMQFKYSRATGFYRKINGNIYGIIRIIWNYNYSEIENAFIRDDQYYLYDRNGNGRAVERDELREVIGDDPMILNFSYNEFTAYD